MDFSKPTNRFNTHSMKWNVSKNELPMWVADMDFKVAKEIIQSLQDNLNHGIFGYSIIDEEYYNSIIKWWESRYNFTIKREWLLFSTGVIPSISTIIRLMDKDDSIIIQPPVYYVFQQCINNNHRKVIDNCLLYEDGKYSIDFDSLEKELKNPKTTLLLLCNPHNPIGKVWERDTLQQIGYLCNKYNVLVVSDEIHCDLVDKGHTYTPFASINETCANNSITTISPSKTFNIADLHVSSLIIPNKDIRQNVAKALRAENKNSPNVFGINASITAYNQCSYWLESLMDYISKNKNIVRKFLEKNIPDLKLINSNATFLLWMDCSKITNDARKLCAFLREETGLYIQSGDIFGKNSKHFLRMNIATQSDRVYDGLNRLKNGIMSFREKGKGIS